MRGGVQYARTAVSRCPMHDPVCAAKVAGHVAQFYGPGFDAVALIEQKCGRYTRGAHKGQLRGWASIERVVEGGWMKYGPGERNGRVMYPGTLVGVSITDFNGKTYLSVGEGAR